MSEAISRAVLHVCLVAQNCLAEAYIEQILRRDPRICVLKLKDVARLSPVRRRNFIVVIDRSGLELPLGECLRELRDHLPGGRFLILDNQKSTDEIVRMLIMGAHGYLPHADASSTLIQAINSLAMDQLWVPPGVLPEFLREANSALRRNARGRQTTSPREDEILELVRRRLSNREIAEILQIRVSTVKFHLSNILSKLNANSRHELIEPAFRRLWKL